MDNISDEQLLRDVTAELKWEPRVQPWTAIGVAIKGDAVTEGEGETETAPPQEASVRTTTVRNARTRERIWRTPFLRRRVCRKR